MGLTTQSLHHLSIHHHLNNQECLRRYSNLSTLYTASDSKFEWKKQPLLFTPLTRGSSITNCGGEGEGGKSHTTM